MLNDQSSPTLANCSFEGNSTPSSGGGMFNRTNSNPSLTNCSFGNNSSYQGGGMKNETDSNPTLINCSFQANSATFGGGMFNGITSPVLINCSFQANSARYGGGMYNASASPVLTNCVVFGNGGSNTFGGSVTAHYSLFESTVIGYGGDNNLTTSTSPFASTASTQLSACSPAINAGSNAAYNALTNPPATDLAGNPRFFNGGQIDMGAYEFQGTPNAFVGFTTQPATGSTVCAGSTVTASVSVSGTGPYTYQWYKDISPVLSQTAATLSISSATTADAGNYSVVVTGSCTSVTSTAFSLTVNALPTSFSVTGGGAYCAGEAGVAVGLSDSQPGVNYQLLRGGTATGTAVAGTGNPISFGLQNTTGTYTVLATNTSTSCTQTMSGSAVVSTSALPTVSIAPPATTLCAGQSTTLTASGANTYQWSMGAITASISVSLAGPYSVTGTNTSTGCSNTATATVTVNPLPNASFSGLPNSVCVDAGALSLSPVTSGGMFAGPGVSGNQFSPASAGAGGPYSITYTVSSLGCPNASVQLVTVNPLPVAPIIATQSGHAYPGGVSSLTISQNTGSVVLLASGCAGGTITWQGGASSTLAVSTMNTGTQTFTATCTSNTTGCTSLKGTATVTVVGTTLSVLHRDATNGQTSTNTLNPYLELQNSGTTAIPYSEITIRYFLTVENGSPLQFQINYAQLGSDKVHLKYVPASTGNPGATGYIEFSFDAAAGSLGAGQNSGPIQDIITKQDFSNFDQSNDYSYVNTGNFTPNPRITAYRNGLIFYGLEPGPVVPVQSVKAMLQNNTGADANSIEAVLSVTNDGNLPINYADLKVRYYFTADNAQPLVLSQMGYTALGSGNVSAQVVTISPSLSGADRYLELSFSPGLGQLAPGASTGGVTYQIRHGDYSGFNQTNDYSYQGTGGMMVNPHVVVFLSGVRAYGTEPGTGARLSAERADAVLRVAVLGNPVTGGDVSVSVRGAEGQPLRYELWDVSGHLVGERQVEQAAAVDEQTLAVGHQPAGLLILRVSTPTQSQTVKILKR